MAIRETNALENLEHYLPDGVERDTVREFIREYARAFQELMSYYRCAMMEVETKFNVLDEELSLRYDRNPIESVKTRLKTPASIMEKLQRNGFPVTIESIERNLNDIAGVRVICSHPSDIYELAEAFAKQDDITVLQTKDYIRTPKENGYRSLHLIIEIPIYLHDTKKMMKVEVQFRTLSMDWWASLEHKIRYKRDLNDLEFVENELRECAKVSAVLDERMEFLQKIANRKDP